MMAFLVRTLSVGFSLSVHLCSFAIRRRRRRRRRRPRRSLASAVVLLLFRIARPSALNFGRFPRPPPCLSFRPFSILDRATARPTDRPTLE